MALQDNAELQRARARLDAREAQLRDEVDDLRGEEAGGFGKDESGNVADTGEQGEQLTRSAVRNVEQRRDTQELIDIAGARQRLDDGRYGECVDCGCDIPVARLQAQPAAARCIPCQERHEASSPAVPTVALPGTNP